MSLGVFVDMERLSTCFFLIAYSIGVILLYNMYYTGDEVVTVSSRSTDSHWKQNLIGKPTVTWPMEKS